MDHLLLKAATTAATDQGTFTAVISTATSDRENDVVDPAAFVDALQKWVDVGKLMPLLWNHSTAPEDHVGHIDPSSAKAVDGEVVVQGWIDRSTTKGADVWRLVKSGTLGFSFGYLIIAASDIKGGGRHITGLDVFEATATSTPMNADTRVIDWKALPVETADALQHKLDEVLSRLEKLEGATQEKSVDVTDKEPLVRSVDPLRAKAESTALEYASGGLSLVKPPKKVEQPRPEPEMSLGDLRRRMRDEVLIHLSGETNE